jgi:L-fuculose-phosphate aldolase
VSLPRPSAEPRLASALELREAVALSCRILAHQGHGHLCFGHVSARGPGDDPLVVKAAGPGLEEVGADDVALADAEGRSADPQTRMHDELPLHTEIYRARADVNAVVHTHPTATLVLSLFDAGFPITSQDAVPFWNRLGFYASADLVTSAAQGRELAASLGTGRAAILRAHGLVAVGADVAEATVNAVLLERAMRTNLAAMAIGDPVPLAEADLASLDGRFERDRLRRIETIWRYLVRALEHDRR